LLILRTTANSAQNSAHAESHNSDIPTLDQHFCCTNQFFRYCYLLDGRTNTRNSQILKLLNVLQLLCPFV